MLRILKFIFILALIIAAPLFLFDLFSGKGELSNDNNTNIDSQENTTVQKQDIISTDTSSSNISSPENKMYQDRIDEITLLLFGSLLLSLILVIIVFYLLWQRNRIIGKTAALVPEKWAKYLDNNSSSIKELERNLGSAFNQINENFQNNEKNINHFQNNLRALTQEIKKLSNIMIDFNSSLDQKDKEIERLKKGYDQMIYTNFLKRVINLHLSIINENKKENLLLLFENFLDEFNVETFEPELNSEFAKAGRLVRETPSFIETEDPENDLKIAGILKKGYRYKNTEEDVILIPAEVSVFQYKNENN